MIKEYAGVQGTHLVEVLEGGAIGSISWVARPVRPVIMPPTLGTLVVVAAPLADAIEFTAELVKDEAEVLVSVFALGLAEATSAVEADGVCQELMAKGWHFRSIWMVQNDEF